MVARRLVESEQPYGTAYDIQVLSAGNGASGNGASGGRSNGAHGPLQPPPPTAAAARCPGCGVLLPGGLAALRPLAPDLVAAWEAERTAAWLRVHDVISCPHPGCGALIMRVPAAAAASSSAPASAAASPHTSPYPSPPPSQRRRMASQGAAAAAPPQPPGGAYGPGAADLAAAARRRAAAEAAAAHRERHRYRCSACRGDFCDLCGAAPYHGGLTCTQARSPECLMCGDPVEQRERLTALLPVAAAAVARDEDGDGGDAGEAEGGPGRDGAGAQDGSGAAAAVGPWAAAVVRRAGRGELLRALRGALDMDTSWCLERRDLERVRAGGQDGGGGKGVSGLTG